MILDTLDVTKLKSALNLIDKSDISNMVHFMCVKNNLREPILDFIANGSFQATLWDELTCMMFLSKEDAKMLEIQIPKGIQLRSLSLENADQVNSIWPHAAPGSEKFISHCIKFNPSVGVYNEKNELLAWCLYHDFGCLFALQTDPNHLRKGYGELAVRAIAKKIANELNFDCVGCIILKNFKSMNLFTKLGFKEIDKNFWMGIAKASS